MVSAVLMENHKRYNAQVRYEICIAFDKSSILKEIVVLLGKIKQLLFSLRVAILFVSVVKTNQFELCFIFTLKLKSLENVAQTL